MGWSKHMSFQMLYMSPKGKQDTHTHTTNYLMEIALYNLHTSLYMRTKVPPPIITKIITYGALIRTAVWKFSLKCSSLHNQTISPLLWAHWADYLSTHNTCNLSLVLKHTHTNVSKNCTHTPWIIISIMYMHTYIYFCLICIYSILFLLELI